MPKICEQCRKEFVVNVHNQRFCSHNCEAKAWVITHRKKMRESCRSWHFANREARLESKRIYHQENREAILMRKRIYYQEHRSEALEYAKQRMEKHPEKVRESSRRSNAKRMAAKLENGGSFMKEEFTRLCEQHDWKCAYCGRVLTPETVTIDHKVPLSRGGSSYIMNIAPACGGCNSSKRATTAEEYMIRLGKKEGQLCSG